MNEILWSGQAPDRALRGALREAGFVLRARRTAGCLARVIARTRLRAGEVTGGAGAELPVVWLGLGKVDAQLGNAAILRGAYDAFSRKQPDAAARLVARLSELCEPLPSHPAAPEFVTASEPGRRLLESLWRAAQTRQPVLLTGETGSGKEIAARLLHRFSARHAHRFVPINCAAVPNDLMEAELFGYVRGAFSGAVQRYDGQLMAAQGGTVFLDEIDDTPLTIQSKLLRVLEDHVVSRLGENEWHRVDFRLIAATNRDLRRLAQNGQFGADLFERLAIVSIEMPPLRARLDDLPVLVEHFIARFYEEEPGARERGMVKQASPEALAALRRYPWPGNIRELRNVVFNALISKRAGSTLLLSDLPRRVLAGGEGRAGLEIPRDPGTPREQDSAGVINHGALAARIAAGTLDLGATVDELERAAIRCALDRSDGSASGAARLLGRLGRGRAQDPGGTLRAMMRRHGLRATEAG